MVIDSAEGHGLTCHGNKQYNAQDTRDCLKICRVVVTGFYWKTIFFSTNLLLYNYLCDEAVPTTTVVWYDTTRHSYQIWETRYNKKEYDDNSKNRQHILNIMYICVSYDVVDDTLLSYHQPRTNIEKSVN